MLHPCGSCELRLTHAPCPTPLHCWGKPPSSGLGSVGTWQSPAAAPPGPASSSSRPRPAAAGTCRPPSRRLWRDCRLKCTSRPVQSEPQRLVKVDSNSRLWFVSEKHKQTARLPYKRRRARRQSWGTLWAARPQLALPWYWELFQKREDRLLLLPNTPPAAGANLLAPLGGKKEHKDGEVQGNAVTHWTPEYRYYNPIVHSDVDLTLWITAC